MTTIKLSLISALMLSTALASAEGKVKKPSVYAAEACTAIHLKGAMGVRENEAKADKDTAMVCQTKSSARVLREWRLSFFGDGDAFVVGR